MTDTPTAAEHEDDTRHDAGGEHRGFGFADMHLAVGDRLQIECSSGSGLGRAFARVIGYAEHHSLLVTAPMAGPHRIDLVENDMVVVRVFSRQSAFAFRASVLRACRLPFHYVHLSYPESVQGSVIRKATRVRAELPCTAQPAGSGEPVPGTIQNISATGLLLCTHAPLGERDGALQLQFGLPLHELDATLDVRADIRNLREDADEDGPAYHYGLDFRELAPNDRLLIKSFVYQTIIEQPRRIL